MSITTIYDVKIRYSVDGRGAAGVRGLTNEVKSLGRETDKVTGLIRRAGAAAVAAFSVRAGAKALIGFNATAEDTRQQIAGMLALTKKTNLADQIGAADKMYSNLQKRAKVLPGTTQEYMQMLSALTQPITDAGGGLQDLQDMTVNATVGAKALRVQWDVAARDIDQALRGQFHSVDQFTGKILGSVGYKGEEGRQKYNSMSSSQRFEVLRGALMQKQLTQLAAAQGQTFNGLLSTFQDTAEQFFGKVGLPLFKAISIELKRWNTWLDANEDKVDAFATKFADGMVKGFTIVKDAVSFLVDHADTLLMIGKVWAAVKLTGMANDFVGNVVGKGGGALSWLRANGSRGGGEGPMTSGGEGGGTFFNGGYQYTKQSKLGMKGVMDNAGLLTQSLALGYTIGTLINEDNQLSDSIAGVTRVNGQLYDATDKTTRQFVELQRAANALEQAQLAAAKSGGPAAVTNMMGRADLAAEQAQVISAYLKASGDHDMRRTYESYARAKELGLGDEDLNKSKMTSLDMQSAQWRGRGDAVGLQTTLAIQSAMLLMTDYQKRTFDEQKANTEVSRYIAQHLKDGNASLTDILHMILGATDDPTGKKNPNVAAKPNVNITIQRIEVASEDPDRYAFGLVEAFRDAVKNPSAAVRAIREG